MSNFWNEYTDEPNPNCRGCRNLEQERDQLKVALHIVTNELESWKATEEDPDSIRAIQIGKQAIRDCKGLSLAEHDAQVIEKFIQSYKASSLAELSTVYKMSAYASQLRQKAQET